MPASIDLGRHVQISHNPVERLDPTLPRLPKMDLAKLFADWIAGLKELTGVDLSILADALNGLQGGINGLRQFVEALIGQGLDLLNLPSPEQAWQQIMTTFLNPLSWLNNIPISAITAATPNLWADFVSADQLADEAPMWVFDAAVKPSGAAGSARTDFDGTVHELISERILLDVGRKVEASIQIKYSGVTTSNGSPIRLSWIGWASDPADPTKAVEVASGDFAVHQPSGAALDWTTLSGSLTRQAGDAWDSLSGVLKTTAGATVGTVWFAAPRATKPDKLPQSLVDGLADALASAGQTIRDAICNALGVPGTGHSDADVIHALTNIPQAAVAGLTTALGNLNAFIQQVVEGVIQAVSGIPFAGAGIADMIATLTGYKKDVATTQSQTKQFVVSSTSGVTRQPGWVSGYPISAATYPAILNSKFNVYADSIGPASAGTAHTHAIPGPTDDATSQAPWWEYGPNTTIGGFITATEDCVFTAYQFAAYSSVTPAAGDYWFEVFRENPDGSLVRVVNSDVSSFIPTSDTLVSLVWTTYRLVAARGERYLARLRNASTSKTLSVKGLAWAFGVPSIQWETSGVTDTNKTSYTNAQKNTIINASTTTPWFVLAANASDIPEAFTWTDDFERNELGYYWSQSVTDTGGNLVIDQGQVAYGGTVNGFQQALYIRTTATDQFRLDVDITGVSASATSIFCGADREGQNGMILSLNSSTVQLTSIIGGTQTVRTTVSRTGNNGKWSVTYNVATKQYQVYFNDIVVPGLTWTDSGSVVPQGALYRYGHIQIIRASGVNGGKVANWLLQDWKP
ncbi:hypothetical protein ACJEIK_26230 [Mycobacterium sp. SMC-16]|uniref:hypothetical protein n=1 Tax=Mycobacterium sp. SMC-16 TaxID=3385967 RepID=UPI00390CBCF0